MRLEFQVPVAQLDRASASGAEAENPQASNKQEVTKPTKDVYIKAAIKALVEAFKATEKQKAGL
ncbi:MAG: hypothetical protein ACYTBP_16000 [Planctomycetota bacterium]